MTNSIINQIIPGDCLQSLKLLDDNSIDLIITSPPYNFDIKYDIYADNKLWKDYTSIISDVACEMYRVLKPDGRVCINIPCDGKVKIYEGPKEKIDFSYELKQIFYNINFKYRDKIYWRKQNISNPNARGSFKSPSCPYINLPYEEIVIFYKDNRKKLGSRNMIDITSDEFISWVIGDWFIQPDNSSKFNHPAKFPIELPYRLIKLFSYIGDIVLDPFAGSGTTCIAAKQLNRKYIGFELSEEYCRIANERLENLNKT